MDIISIRVLCAKRSKIFSLSHCIVLLSIRSFTFSPICCSPKKTGLWESHLCGYPNSITITHFPLGSFPNNFPSSQWAPPYIRRITPQFSIYKRTLRKIPWFYTLKNNEWLLWISLLACFASNAELNAWASQISSHLYLLDCITSSN